MNFKFGLEINRTKMKTMIIDVCNTSQITENLNSFEMAVGIAKSAMRKLTNMCKDHLVFLTTKVRLVPSYMFSIFLYGVETWTKENLSF